MPNLYELTEEIQSLQNAFECGEIPEDAFADTLEGLQMGFGQKVENICKWVSNLNADAAAFDAESKRLSGKKSAAKKQADRLKSYLQSALNATGQKKFKAGTFTASIAKSPAALRVFDERLIPTEYYTTPLPVINNAAIKDAIKAGQTVSGAELVQGEHINIK